MQYCRGIWQMRGNIWDFLSIFPDLLRTYTAIYQIKLNLKNNSKNYYVVYNSFTQITKH